MIDLVRRMAAVVGVPLPEAVRMATKTPAWAMGWKKKGVLAEGMEADLVVLSPELEVVQTYCGGQAA
jgi:N-acetylglucosamine-6-phosphate deacetylase